MRHDPLITLSMTCTRVVRLGAHGVLYSAIGRLAAAMRSAAA